MFRFIQMYDYQRNILWGCYLLFIAIFPSTGNSKSLVIESRVNQQPWRRTKAIYPIKNQQITLRVRKISGGIIRWYQIRPYLNKMYKNANHPWEKNPYKWIGLGKISYQRYLLPKFNGKWQIRPFTSPIVQAPSEYYRSDLGSFWFQAEVNKNGKVLSSPGLAATTREGISPKVLRISIRERDDLVGWVTSFFNVPSIFGSITRQSNNYQGVDCADMLVAAHSRWLGGRMRRNYNVAMLVNKFPKVARSTNQGGNLTPTLVWNKDVRRGDFIAVRYLGARQFQHIGVLTSDTNANGILDGADQVLHTGPWPLQYSPLSDGGFDGTVVILRPTRRLTR